MKSALLFCPDLWAKSIYSLSFGPNLSFKTFKFCRSVLGAIREEKVMVFSGGGPALLWLKAVITKQSPEVTAFTRPLSHQFFSLQSHLHQAMRLRLCNPVIPLIPPSTISTVMFPTGTFPCFNFSFFERS